VAGLRGVPADYVLDGAGSDVAVVGRSGGEGRAVVEGVGRQMLCLLELLLEGANRVPIFESLLFLLREVNPLRNCIIFLILGLKEVF
jgi:hypothetical protein